MTFPAQQEAPEAVLREMPDIAARASRVIEGMAQDAKLAMLIQYVEQGERDRLPESDLNALRRLYIRHASEIYRTRHYG